MPETILIVDDETEIADLIELYLKNELFDVRKFYSSADALACVEQTPFDLAILDIMLPGMDGFTLCRRIRERWSYPIIMLTAKDAETDKITGLALGADDYITKPFRPLELVARVKAQLRRWKRYNPARADPGADAPLCRAGLTLDPATHTCTLDEQPLELTPTEFSILRILLENRGRVVSSEELFRRVWEQDYFEKDSNTITVHIRHLREKLHDTVDRPKYIRTVWGVGYRIDAS